MVLGRAQALRDGKAEVELFNLTPEGQDFSMDFWQQFVGDPDEEDVGKADYQPMRIQVPPPPPVSCSTPPMPHSPPLAFWPMQPVVAHL